jgi:hypothetical protein
MVEIDVVRIDANVSEARDAAPVLIITATGIPRRGDGNWALHVGKLLDAIRSGHHLRLIAVSDELRGGQV